MMRVLWIYIPVDVSSSRVWLSNDVKRPTLITRSRVLQSENAEAFSIPPLFLSGSHDSPKESAYGVLILHSWMERKKTRATR